MLFDDPATYGEPWVWWCAGLLALSLTCSFFRWLHRERDARDGVGGTRRWYDG